jgi:hypothetical protein
MTELLLNNGTDKENHGSSSSTLFSEQFMDEYEKRTSKKTIIWLCWMRSDPIAIAIFKEKGSEWCCRSGKAQLRLESIPALFGNHYKIKKDTFDDEEHIVIHWDALHRQALQRFVESGDSVEATKYAYNKYLEMEEAFTKNPRMFVVRT